MRKERHRKQERKEGPISYYHSQKTLFENRNPILNRKIRITNQFTLFIYKYSYIYIDFQFDHHQIYLDMYMPFDAQ